jgi:hydrogenase/urease accessory protein HupE
MAAVRSLRVLIFLCVALCGSAAGAHEVRPAYLEITQRASGQYFVLWKRPTQGDIAVRLVPHLSNGWLDRPPAAQYLADGFLIRTWSIDVAGDAALRGGTLTIEGLEYTLTDVFVRIRLLDGYDARVIVRPENPVFTVEAGAPVSSPVLAYLRYGVEHILSGPDHLLFVLGLLLLVRNRWKLVQTVSAFTLAHSITLTATVIGALRVPVPFVEALIALSILFLALEVLRAQRGGDSFAIRHPWAVAFAFGLFHGMGFASGLAALGLGQHDLLATLALFNIGVEIGQLCFIAVALLAAYGLRKTSIGRWTQAAAIPAYVIGIAGTYWSLQCSAAWIGVQS